MGSGARSEDRRGSAGRRGEGVRSDIWIAVELADHGGVRLELESRVEPYYGDAIREQVDRLLSRLGVSHAAVEIEDTGALPFVIAARLETALRRAGHPCSGDGRPGRTVPDAAPSARDRLRRSRLYVPGNEPKYFPNAGLYGADGIILDLEDSVGHDDKDAARLLVRNALRTIDFKGAERMVRINLLPAGLDDLEAIVPERPDLILIPKVETADQVRAVDQKVSELVDDTDEIWLMPILESALGIENSFDVARACPRVAGLTIGLEDYAADLGVDKTPEGFESMYARKRMVNAAKAARVQAIDSVYGQVDDLEGLRAWASRARQLGFEGMGCVHPRQIPTIHEAFDPSADQIQRALRIVEAFEHAEAAGLAVVSLGSKMIDPPVVEQARQLVRRATVLGLLPDRGSDR